MQHATKTAWADHWKAEIEGKLDSVLGSSGPGGSIYALENNSEVMAHSFGKASVANKIDFTVDTPCGVRSVTKVMTCAAAQAAEEFSKLNWLRGEDAAPHNGGGVLDKPIKEFRVISANIDREENKYLDAGSRPPLPCTDVTIRDLAAHQGRINEIWGIYSGIGQAGNDRGTLKNLMESIGNIDDLVAQAGAVLGGVSPEAWADLNDPTHPNYRRVYWWEWGTDHRNLYNDKAHWLTGAVIEMLFGMTLYQVLQAHFRSTGITDAYPSYDGNVIGQGTSLAFKGHNANPVEIAGLAVPYSVYRGPNGDQLFLEPEQSTESAYAIGSAVMSSRNLAKWGNNLRWGRAWPLSDSAREQMFSVQTGNPEDLASPQYPNWPGVNWGFGPQKLQSVVGNSTDTVEVWGTIGQGGFGGYGGCVVWVEHNGTQLVIAANTNTGIEVRDAYHAAKDYIESFL